MLVVNTNSLYCFITVVREYENRSPKRNELATLFWLSRLKIYGFVPIWGLWLEKNPSEGPKNKNDPIFDIFRAFLSENISV